MNKCIASFYILFVFVTQTSLGQNQCVYKPKKFPSAFPQLNFDYYGLANQPETVQKGSFQIESASFLENLIEENQKESKIHMINIFLMRVGFGNNLEFRAYLNSLFFNAPKEIHFGSTFKYSIPTKLNSMPYLGFLMDYSRFDDCNAASLCFLSESKIKDIILLSADVGIKYMESKNPQFCYGIKSQMKPPNLKTGIFVIASNKYVLLDNVLLFGILITNNRKSNITISYGVTDKNSLFKIGFSFLFQS